MGVDVAVPEAHVMLAALGDVDLDAIGGIEPQRRAVGLVDVARAELLGKHVDHAEDVAVLQHAGVDHRRLVVGEDDVLSIDGDELAIDLLRRLLLIGLGLVHGLPLFQSLLSSPHGWGQGTICCAVLGASLSTVPRSASLPADKATMEKKANGFRNPVPEHDL